MNLISEYPEDDFIPTCPALINLLMHTFQLNNKLFFYPTLPV
jgi:hypothetical protein